jgi:adenylyltransferase/sulfurtransferase
MNQVTVTELKQWIDEGKDFVLVDIREDWEREAFNFGGIHIPMGSLIASLDEIPTDKDVVMYCEKGIRSVLAIQRLETFGLHNLINLSGGVSAWKRLGQ